MAIRPSRSAPANSPQPIRTSEELGGQTMISTMALRRAMRPMRERSRSLAAAVRASGLFFSQLNVTVSTMRPGAPSRLGEAAAMAPELARHYGSVTMIEGPGFIEGGDILVTGREILVGRSARTDAAGVDELRTIVAAWGYKLREVETPPGVLHFKTDSSLLDEETILSTARLAASGCFSGYRVINTAPGEDAAANAIRFNDLVLLPPGFPRTAETLAAAGYNLRQIGNSEAAKLDGGMSCLSLRFSVAR